MGSQIISAIVFVGAALSCLQLRTSSRLLKANVLPNTFIGVVGVWITFLLTARIQRYTQDFLVYVEKSIAAKDFSFGKFLFSVSDYELGFSALQWIAGRSDRPGELLLVMVWLLFYGCLICACRILGMSPRDSLATLLVLVCLPTTAQFMTNGMRQAVAISLVLVCFALVAGNRGIQFLIPPVLAAYLFHRSSLLVTVPILLYQLGVLNSARVRMVWMVSLITFVTGSNRLLGELISDEQLGVYTRFKTGLLYGGGSNRLDFLLVSTFLSLLAWWIGREGQNIEVVRRSADLVLISSLAFMLFGFIFFSDRLLAYQLSVFPIFIGVVMGSLGGSLRKYRGVLVATVVFIPLVISIVVGDGVVSLVFD